MSRSSWIRQNVEALSAYVPGLQTADAELIKLNTNENPYPPPPGVGQVLRNLDPARLRLYPDPIATRVRDQLAARHGARPEQIFCGNGSDEVLALMLRAFVEQDEEVGFFEPSYSLYPVLCDIQGLRYRRVPLTGSYTWPSLIGEGLKLFFLTHPNAPTGMVYPRAEIESFIDGFDGVVVIDEAYADFAEGNLMDLALNRPHVLVTRTLSKSASLAGIRFGYAVGPEALIDALYKIKDSYNLNAMTLLVAEAALADPDWIEENIRRVKATRARLSTALQERGFTVYPSQANFLWVEPPTGLAEDWLNHLQTEGILVRFFAALNANCLRMTIGTDAQMDRLLNVIDARLES